MIQQKRLLVLAWFILLLVSIIPSMDSKLLSNHEAICDFRMAQSSFDVDYLIITCDDYVDTAQALADWKMQRGLVSSIETVEDITDNYEGLDSAEAIRSCIIDYYTNYDLTWVVLAGGHTVVPTRRVSVGGSVVSCDFYYSNLDDNWDLRSYGVATLLDADAWEPEVFVGRLPADTETQLSRLITRLIQYEKSPPVGEWMKHAVYAGTFCNFDYDANENNVLDDDEFPAFDTNRNHNWMRTNLLPAGWTSTMLAETEGVRITEYYYDGQLNESSFVRAINQGASVVMADAHGSPTGMARTIFTTDVDGDTLFDSGTDQLSGSTFVTTSTEFDVEGRYGFYFLAACSTGTFREGTCLTEYITRTSGIGCIGSSQSSGYDPFMFMDGDDEHLGWLTQGFSERFWKQILVEGKIRPGKALALAKHDYSRDRVRLNGSDDNGKTMAQYNLMGDPEVPLWMGLPSSFETPIIMLNEENREIHIEVIRMGLEPSNSSVTLHNENHYRRTITSSGKATLVMPDLAEDETFTITLSHDGYIPYQIDVDLPAGSLTFDHLPMIGLVGTFALVLVVLAVGYRIKKP